ncbi:MAG: DUF349 domain-containing protein [Alistipes sp.]|nr:DUF349 domain-containing protein [Alistipes sp.]
MATENPNLSVPEERLSAAEDVQNISESVARQAQESAAAEAESAGAVDFADEDAALDARNAGLDLGEESAEEELACERSAGEELNGKSKEELLSIFARMLAERPVQTLRRDVEALKIAFYKLRRAEVEAARRAASDEERTAADADAAADAAELRFKDLFREYRRLRDEFAAAQEAVKEENLRAKLAVVEELKELTASDERLDHTFEKFRELQRRWKELGAVPQQHVKDLWENYNLQVENFYNFVKINKELRDLDLKKNYERKAALCEAAEALQQEGAVVEAFRKLQKLHDQWRETGPVANEYKEVLWERFKEASSRINRRHQEYFEGIKREQLHNLELKSGLCARVEELLERLPASRRDWNKASESLFEIQKEWKTIGFAPKKDNNAIYERFRNGCDRFFEAKRAFYAGVKDEMEENLRRKIELCEAAEALRGSEEWKKTTDELIALQTQWKQTGAVSRRHSDQVWKRFRAACDAFFERKAAHFAEVDDQYGENLRRKEALLEEMAGTDVQAGGFEAVKEFQRRWSEIGFVPIKRKEALQKRYKEIVDKMFETLRGAQRDRSMGRFREKVSTLKASGDRRLRTERDRLANRVRQLEQEIALLENNVGFFARSKNADAMVAEVRGKIDRGREELRATIEKVRLIDRENRE